VGAISAQAIAGLGEVRAGADLAELIVEAAGGELAPASVVAIAHTVVSKAEGAVVELEQVEPGERARALAGAHGKDPRAVQVVLEQSAEVLRAERGVLISRTHHGLVCANAGVDVSNAGGAGLAVLLPRDPDASARAIRTRLREILRAAAAAGPVAAPLASSPPPAVLITDTFGRAWRNGQTDVAIGIAGMQPLDDWRGRRDADGTELVATWLAVADAAAGAADLARRKDSREPVVVLRGLEGFVTDEDGPGAAALLRPPDEDLFR
jgi:coenzyme F420-0:L-glutamate ligase/coenzyme F420-1:gamma-L-glutamate ligase